MFIIPYKFGINVTEGIAVGELREDIVLETYEPQSQSLNSGHMLKNREILKKLDRLSQIMLAPAVIADTEEPKKKFFFLYQRRD